MPRPWPPLLAALLAAAACESADRPAATAAPSHCAADAAQDPLGSGGFGCWFTDAAGLLAYEYTMPPGDPRARTFTWGDYGAADDHWHQVGNGRLKAMAHVDGRIRVFDPTRGPKWVSEYSAARLRVDGNEAAPAARRLVFGMGYVETATELAGVAATRTVYAPWGARAGDPVLLIEHRLENRSDREHQVEVTELWDGGLRQVDLQLAYALNIDGAEGVREEQMTQFEQLATFDAARDAVLVDTRPAAGVQAPPRDEASPLDYHPGALALALLDGPADGFALRKRVECEQAGCTPAALATTSIATARIGPPRYGLLHDGATSAGPLPATDRAFAAELGRAVTVPAGATATVRFALAYAGDAELPALLDGLRAAAPTPAENAEAVKGAVAAWSLPQATGLDAAAARELAWHAYYFLSSAGWEEYFGVRNVDQASAYGYLQGLRGAARDSLINAVAAVHVDPALARDQIVYVLETTHPDTARISYGTAGYGIVTDAGIHDRPSDLQLWLMWAVVEYVQATRDFAFLDEVVAYWPPAGGVSDSVVERLGRSLDWLMTDLGVGDHGLLRVGSGDWSDGISFLAASRDVFHELGESTFNTAFAAYVFPRLAALVQSRDAMLAQRLDAAGTQFAAAVADQYEGRWFYRAWDGAGAPLGGDRIFLEHHAWILLGDVPTPEQRAQVIQNIDQTLSAPSPIGTWVVHPPIEGTVLEPGWDVNGGIWAAMNGLLAWGLARTDPARGFAEYVANSMANHAEVYPGLWYGIWSGPDAYNAAYAARPGETFYHAATPMTDFPVCNSNRHAWPLIDAVKLSGIEYTAEGIVVDPRVPFAEVRFDSALVNLDVVADGVQVRLRFQEAGTATVRLPSGLAGAADVGVTVGTAAPQRVAPVDGWVTFAVPAGDTQIAIAP